MCKKLSFLLSFVLLAGFFSVSAIAADYYIDPVSGSDTSGDGSLGNPWESFKNIQYYYSGPDYPPGWVQLQPGETIYLMDGVHNTLVNSGGGYPDMIAFFRFFNGNADNWFHIKAYPGHNPILDASGTSEGIRISSCSYWEVEGFELRNCAKRGIDLEGLNPGNIHDIHIHDVDGDSRNNVCALELNGCSNVEVYDSVFGDVIDSTCETNGTCWRGMMGIAIFASTSGADISVHDCDFYRTPSVDYTTGGIMYKHGSQVPGSYFDVYNNTFTELRTTSFQTGTANTHFHHNLIVDSATGVVKSQDFGGTTHQTNQTFEYNTFYNAPGFYFSPTTNWINEDFPDDPTNINFNNNIIYSTDVQKIHLNQYMSDVLYYITVDEYHSNYNCYYNPNLTVHEFRFASAWNEQPDYSEGGVYSLSQWQSNFGWGLDSVEADPCFVDAANGDFRLLPCSPCKAMGIHVGDFDDSNTIDWGDVNEISEKWLDTGACIESDLNNDNVVNFGDFAEFGKVWAAAYINSSDPNYQLTVNSGSGDGLYKENAVVPISADIIGGMIFAEWTGDISGIANIYAAGTTLTMPAANVTITATYVPVPTYLLTVNNGSGGGNYEEDQVVPVSANAALPGEEFSHWAGETAGIANIYLASTTVTMPAQAVTITAMYKDIGTVFITEEFGDAVDTNYPGTVEDTYANAGSSTSNFSTDAILNTYTWPADTVANTIIIKWDLSALPSDTVVAEATLYLYQVDSRGDVPYDVGAHKIINVDPNITTCTWNTYDGINSWTGGANGGQGDIASAEDIPGLNNTDNEYKAWRVTNMVKDWVSVPANNFGMLVNSDGTALVDHYRFFASTEDADTSIRPKLLVTYISAE